jgi:hypothetical protein
MSDETSSVCKVGDPYFAAHLYALGRRLSRIDRLDSNRSSFLFIGDAEEAGNDYYNDEECLLASKDLFSSFKNIRSASMQIEMLSDGCLGVKDIYFATYLRYKGYKIIRTERLPFQSRFIFQDIPPEIILAFYNGVVENIRSRQIFENFKGVRNLSSRLSREE